MAESQIDRKSSAAWLPWLLLGAGALAVAWWFVGTSDRELAASRNGPQELYPAGGDIPDMAQDMRRTNQRGQIILSGAEGLGDLDNLIGRDVELSGVTVKRVIADQAFTVGQGTRETLVTFDEARMPATATEGGVEVEPGSRVAVSGNVRAFPGDIAQSLANEVDTSGKAMIFAGTVETVR